MTKYGIITIVALVFYSCTSNNKQTTNPALPSEKITDSFFPVTSFIKGQMIILDSLPITPLRLTTIKQHTDSAWLPKKDVRAVLAPFLVPEINQTNFTNHFTETKFKDQTLNAITFTYDPKTTVPDSIALRHWDVYIDPEKGDVMKIYIVKKVKENKRVLTQQLTWQTNKLARITTILNKPDGNMELVEEMVLIWDF
ncbi:MAG: hypothetical protein ABIN01_18730 [Ferruginibacter sp.]